MLTRTDIIPFPGLRPYHTSEDYLFFGRETQIVQLLNRLRKNRFVAVVGTSGSGKSSLVRAGLIPGLLGGTMMEAGSNWEIALMRPGGRPLHNLAQALVDTQLYESVADDLPDRVRAMLDRSRLGLTEVKALSDTDDQTNLLVVVDQFEEVFRFNRREQERLDEAADFVNLLLEGSSQRKHPIYVVITMRSDFLGDCSKFPGLAEAVNGGEYLVPRMTWDQCREAIEGPVEVGGGTIAPRLIDRLLNDVGEESEQLSVLQHALMRIWESWKAEQAQNPDCDGPLDLAHYDAVGGMSSALSHHADEVLEDYANPELDQRLSITQQAYVVRSNQLSDREGFREGRLVIARRVFQALTERGADGRETRRPQTLEQLCKISGAEESEVIALVEAFRRPGVTFLMPGQELPLEPGTVIDISHESFMRVWRRLHDWVADEEQSARLYRRLRESAELYAESKSGLYRDPDLQIAQSWREEFEPNEAWAEQYGGNFEETMLFLDESEEQAHHAARSRETWRHHQLAQAEALAEAKSLAARNFKWFAVAMGGITLAALVAFKFAFFARRDAETKRDEVMALEVETNHFRYVSELAAAQQALASDDLGKAKRMLKSHAQENPGWEWRYLWAQTLGDEVASLGPFDNSISGDRSFDGRWLGVQGARQGISVWDTRSFHCVYQDDDHRGSLAFSPTENLLAIAVEEGVYLRGIKEDGSMVESNPIGLRAKPVALTFSSDGKRLAFWSPVEGAGAQVEVWDLNEASRPFLVIRSSASVEGIRESGRIALDDRRLVIGENDGKIRVHSLVAGEDFGKELYHISHPHPEAIRALAISGDGKWLASSTAVVESEIQLWHLDTGEHHETLAGHRRYVSQLEFTRDGASLYSAGTDQTVRRWDPVTGKQLQVIVGNEDEIYSLALCRDETGHRTLTTWSRDGMVRFFDCDRTERVSQSKGHSVSIQTRLSRGGSTFGFASHDQLLATIGSDGKILLIDTTSLEIVPRELANFPPEVLGLTFSRDGRYLLASAGGGYVCIYDLVSATVVLRERIAGGENIWPVGFTQGNMFATSSPLNRYWNKIQFWSWDGSSLRKEPYEREAQRMCFGADGQLVLVDSPSRDDSRITFYPRFSDLSALEVRGEDALSRWEVTAISMFQEGSRRLLGATGAEGDVAIWNAADLRKPVVRYRAHPQAANDLEFFQDGERLVVAGLGEENVKIWDWSREEDGELLVLEVEGWATEVRVSPDDTVLGVVSEFRGRNTLTLWRAPSGEELKAIEGGKVIRDPRDRPGWREP